MNGGRIWGTLFFLFMTFAKMCIRDSDKTTAKCKCEPIYDKSDRDKTIDWDGKLIKNTRRFRIVLVQGLSLIHIWKSVTSIQIHL